jgi:MFS transporter, UMF1 family
MASITAAVGAADTTSTQGERTYRRRTLAWSLYDWADHAYTTTLLSTFFPPYLVAIAAPAFLLVGQATSDDRAMAVARDTASNVYALVVSLALFVAAFLAPLVGTYADITGARKRVLVLVTLIGGALASLLFAVTMGLWVLGLVLYFVSQLAYNIALGLDSSLLPHVARPKDLNRVSSLGYAMGYIGGGVLLLVNTVIFLFADKLGIDSSLAVRLAFLSVGIWWVAFMIPMALNVPEPPATPLAHGSKGNAFLDSFTRIGHTLRDIQRYRELFKMLIAFWLYSEGIGAIILLATAYGAALGLNTAVLIGTLLMTQFVAFPYALIYGRIPNPAHKWRGAFVSMLIWTGVTLPLIGVYANLTGSVSILATFGLIAADQILGILFSIFIGRHLFAGLTNWLDTKRAIILGLVIYTIIPVWGFFLHTQAEFFLIGWIVGTVQGGTQALSRSIYADLSPRAKSGEFFGLYGLSEKFAGILGPLLYGIVGLLTHDPRASVLSISVFFLIGIWMLWRVDEYKGAEIAAAEEAQIEVEKVAD